MGENNDKKIDQSARDEGLYRKKKTVSFMTLGCKVNTYETEGMKRIFEKGGYNIVDPESPADVVIINTCTVTHLSDKKSRQMVRRARRLNPNAIIAAVGCYAQIAPHEVSAIKGVNLVIGNNHKGEILKLVEESSFDSLKVAVSERNDIKGYEDLQAQSFTGQTRAFLKIQDGCNQFCSYCIIPYARGGIRSRSLESILMEAVKLSENNFKEIVLTGIHLTSYGMDSGEHTLLDVIKSLNGIKGIERIRLGSLEPFHMSGELISKMSEIEKLCPHFHLSLQSGCDKTLMRMNRKYTTGEYMEIVEIIRHYFPDAAVTTDIMTGFPGETDEEFLETCNFVKRVGFSQAHVFQYSVRKGTRAASMPDQVSPDVKEYRSKILIQICEDLKRDFRQKYIDKTLDVLFEHERDGLMEGHTSNYIPVRVPGALDLSGEIKPVRLVEIRKDFVLGQIV